MAIIANGMPQNMSDGTRDNSRGVLKPQPREMSIHLPVFATYTEKGGYVKDNYDYGEFITEFGESTLDPRSKYYNHVSRGIKTVFEAGGTIEFQKLKVVDELNSANNSSRAGVTVFGAVADTQVKIYERTVTGEKKIPENVINTVAGKNMVLMTAPINLDAAGNPVIPTDVKITDADGVDQPATLYPLFTVQSLGENAIYNKLGFGLRPFIKEFADTNVVTKNKVIEYNLNIVSKETGIKRNLNTAYGDVGARFTFKPKQRHPLTKAGISIRDVFPKLWNNKNDFTQNLTSPAFDRIKVYNGLDQFLEALTNNEKTIIEATSADVGDSLETKYVLTNTKFDLEDEVERRHLFNFVDLIDIEGLPYLGTMIAAPGSVTLGATTGIATNDLRAETPIYLTGGKDGNIEDEVLFEKMFLAFLDKYLDKDSDVINTALNKESVIYDTGFSFATKLKIPLIKTWRRDIIPVLNLNVDSEDRILTNSERVSRAVALKNVLALMPESTFYGTPASRGFIIGIDGEDIDGVSDTRVAGSIDWLSKSTLYMGSTEGRFDSLNAFDIQDGNHIKKITNIEPKAPTESLRQAFWSIGVIYAEPDDRGVYFYPASQGIYNDDTSILNIWGVNVAIAYLHKVSDMSWRKFSGSTNLNRYELAREVEEFVNKEIEGKLAASYVVIPTVTYLKSDIERGYSWRLKIEIKTNTMMTVQVSHIEASRLAIEGA